MSSPTPPAPPPPMGIAFKAVRKASFDEIQRLSTTFVKLEVREAISELWTPQEIFRSKILWKLKETTKKVNEIFRRIFGLKKQPPYTVYTVFIEKKVI